MQKTNIAPEILQPFFESAANAAERGQSQYFTLWKAFHKVKYGEVDVMERLSSSALE